MRFSTGVFLYFLRGLSVNCVVAFVVLEVVQGTLITLGASEGVSFDFLIIFPVLVRAFGQALNLTLPVALLFGTGLFVGRLNGDREMIALRSMGFSDLQLLGPVLALGTLCGVVNLFLSFELVPRLHFSNRNVGTLILEQLGYLGEGWDLEYQSGARHLWIHHYNGPVLDGIFLGVSKEGEGTPVAEERLKEVDAPVFPICLFADRGYVFRGTGDLEGRAVISLKEVSVFYDHDLVGSEAPSDFMDRVRLEQVRWTPTFTRKPPGVKDLSTAALEETTRSMYEALRKAKEEGADPKVVERLERKYAGLVGEFHRRLALALTALTLPASAFILGLFVKSQNRLLPFFLASSVIPLVYFLFNMVGGQQADRGVLPALTQQLGNLALLVLALGFLLMLRRGPR
jgi:lipopolysaccharide export LptBFGC system permease protein LptF